MTMQGADLERFVAAQERVIDDVEAELAAGSKRSHWMWFVFPQLAGLGHSPTAQFYGLAGIDEARRYLAHPVLGRRLRDHVRLLMRHRGVPARTILGSPDDLKLRSCLTLFREAAADPADRALFEDGLAVFYGAQPDTRTLALLRG